MKDTDFDSRKSQATHDGNSGIRQRDDPSANSQWGLHGKVQRIRTKFTPMVISRPRQSLVNDVRDRAASIYLPVAQHPEPGLCFFRNKLRRGRSDSWR